MLLTPMQGFTLCIEAHPPYRATLRTPCGSTKLLSAKEAYVMLCHQAVEKMNHTQLKGR